MNRIGEYIKQERKKAGLIQEEFAIRSGLGQVESEYRSGYVYIQNHFAGIIAETEEGYSFSYDKDYLEREDACLLYTSPSPRDCD